MPETLELRAARYFGHHDQPRTAIRLNNTSSLIVAKGYGSRTLVMYYDEQHGRPTGHFIKLTPRALKEFREALFFEAE